MVGSFIALAILFTLRIWWGTLTDKFRWMSKVLTVLNYGMLVCIGIFAVFTVIALVKAIVGGGRKGRRDR